MLTNVRFWGQSGRDSNGSLCRLMTQSGRRASDLAILIAAEARGYRQRVTPPSLEAAPGGAAGSANPGKSCGSAAKIDRLPVWRPPPHDEVVNVLADMRSCLRPNDIVLAENLDGAVERNRTRIWSCYV